MKKHNIKTLVNEEQDQLCWECKKACTECLWSKYYIPIKGWTAEQTVVKDPEGDFTSYYIRSCPEFVKG